MTDSGAGQHAIYVEGIGLEDGAGDNTYGMGTGRGDTGVVRKTDKAVAALTVGIQEYLLQHASDGSCTIKRYNLIYSVSVAGLVRHGTLPIRYSVRTVTLSRRSEPV
ncbi:hypothetical protein ACL655_12050 [Klebsiella quasipneumoniae subsp. similipneumoniae]